MSEICKCGHDMWYFATCELMECEGHWVCKKCGKAWDEQ